MYLSYEPDFLYAWEYLSSGTVFYFYLLSRSATISMYYCTVKKGGVK